MKCSKIQNKLSAYLQGDLPLDEASIIKEHQESCSHCRKEIERNEQAWKALEVWEGIDPSPEFLTNFWSRVDRSSLDTPVKSISLAEQIRDFAARLFKRPLPAWAVLTLLLISFFAGHLSFPKVEERYIEVVVREPASYSIAKEWESLPEDFDIAMHHEVLPRPLDVINTMQNETPEELLLIHSFPDNDGLINRVNLDDIMEL